MGDNCRRPISRPAPLLAKGIDFNQRAGTQTGGLRPGSSVAYSMYVQY